MDLYSTVNSSSLPGAELLGVDNVHLHNSIADIRGKNGAPISRLRPLGWTCVGITSEKASKGESSHLVHFLKKVLGDRQL